MDYDTMDTAIIIDIKVFFLGFQFSLDLMMVL